MKTLSALAAVLACALLAAGSPARADDRADIAALYAKLRQAILTNHPEATLAMETPDFVSKGEGGRTMNGKQLAEQMKAEHGRMKLKTMTIKIDKMAIHGRTADVTTSFAFSTEMVDKGGQMGPKGKAHLMAATGTIHNTLVKTAQGWKFKTMDERAGAVTMDGKPFNPAGMGGPTRKK